jgi:hypothetical protein
LSRLLALAALLVAALFGVPAAAMAGGAAQPGQVLVMLRMPAEHVGAGAGYAGGYGDGPQRAARQRIAERIAHAYGLTPDEGWPMPLVGLDCFVMSVPAGRSPADVAATISKDRRVAWSQPLQTFHAESASPPNDPMFRLQPAAAAWRLADLHAVSTGRNVRIAVVDSGVDARHPDLRGQIETQQDFAPGHPGGPEQHGTAVAGVIAAIEDNGVGIAGVAPDARILALRACWQQAGQAGTVCDSLSLARALQYAIEHDAEVINLSLSGPQDPLLSRLIDVALGRGATVVAAMDPAVAQGGFPASHAGVVAVASAPGQGGLVAPGRDVPTTEPGGAWELVNGSSFAAAHVSGLAALWRQKAPSARKVAFVTLRPGGAIDACATLERVARACGPPGPATTARR